MKMSLLKFMAFVIAGNVTASAAGSPDNPAEMNTIKIFSRPLAIDREYRSMAGPLDKHHFLFDPQNPPELIWLTAAKTELINAKNRSPVSSEYLCHSNLNFQLINRTIDERNAIFDHRTHPDKKILDLVQGHTDIQFPKNFGIPLISNEPVYFASMVINPTLDEEPFDIQVRTSFEFMRDGDLSSSIKPLFRRGVTQMVPVNNVNPDGSLNKADPVHSCEHSDTASKAVSTMMITKKEPGKDLSAHWTVPPGRHTYRYILEDGLRIPFDTTIHFIGVHLHPFAESLELKDVTDGKTVFKSEAKNMDGRLGIARASHYSDAKGLPAFKDHRYELISVYNNTTEAQIDAMAVMYLYYWDKEFDKARLKISAAP